MNEIVIGAGLISDGCVVKVGDRSYEMSYPPGAWKAFPDSLKEQFAETLAYFFTHHLALPPHTNVIYNFPPPLARSLFVHGFLYSLVGSTLEFSKKKAAVGKFLRMAYNAEYQESFTGSPQPLQPQKARPFEAKVNKVAIPFSFGKDSLLTYALACELKLTPLPYFSAEPTSSFENINKGKLIKQFQKEQKVSITTIDLKPGNLRDASGLLWGWDMLLTQYTLILLPYLYSKKIGLLAWSNEQSTNETEISRSGHVLNAVHEQSINWTLNLNNLLRIFNHNCIITSLVEPVHELAIMYILHRKYPEVGKFQLSCFNDHKKSATQRWCGHCYECARNYVFLLAVGVDPITVGLTDNMLKRRAIKLHYIFSRHWTGKREAWIGQYGEWILAFYLATKRGAKGDLIDLFKQECLQHVEPHAEKLLEKYLSLYPSKTIPVELVDKLVPIYQEELDNFREEIRGL